MRILIADDDPGQLLLLQRRLVHWGYDVLAAADGGEAWRILQGPDSPRMAILDWQMPDLDGPEICRKVRERPDSSYLFIILLTARDRKEDIVEGIDAGADDYLTKPFFPHELQVRLRAGRRILDLESALRASLQELQQRDEQLAHAHRREVEIGARIQQALLIGHPPQALPSARLAALTIASQQIDGDFYDFFKHNDHCLDVVVGDVMGKGIPAALLGAAIKSHLLRSLSQLTLRHSGAAVPPGPEELVSLVHEEVIQQFINLERFITLVYARFYMEERRVELVDCGHTATLHFHRQSGDCTLLQGVNMPIGFSTQEVYRQVSELFEAGDIFVFYSDGVTEAQDTNEEQFGLDRLIQLVRSQSHLPPEELVDAVRRAVVAHTGAETFDDDLTCVAIKIEEVPPFARSSLQLSSALDNLPEFRGFVRAFCERSLPGTGDDSVDQLELAVSEAVANVMRHAYEGRSDGLIELEASAYTDRVYLRIIHTGDRFDPAAVSPPAFDGSRESGFGVYFIAQCVDEVIYSEDDLGRNIIELTKRVKGASPSWN